MKIIKPYYEILTDINGSEILKTIESIARVCYKSENLITEDSANKLVKALLNRGHLAMLEFYDITVKFICDRGCCYSDDTFVLTENGFKLFKDVLVDEKIYTKDDNGQLLLINYINKIEMPYNGDLINFKSTQIDLLVTPNHNCWVYDYQKRSDKTRKWKFIQASAIVNKKYKFFIFVE